MNKLKYYYLENNQIKVELTSLGASMVQIWLKKDNHLKPVMSRPLTEDDFIENTSYGRTIGRTAGFLPNTETTRKYVNFDTESIKHGGPKGIQHQVFEVNQVNAEKIEFDYVSKDLENHFYGNMMIKVIYEIVNSTTLRVTHIAKTNRETLCNLTVHPYFNLTGKPTIEDHLLYIESTTTAIRSNGSNVFNEIIDVKGTFKDFSTPKNLVVDDKNHLDDIYYSNKDKELLRLSADGITLKLRSNYPTMVVFTQNATSRTDLSVAAKGAKYSSIAIECQRSQLGLPILEAGEDYNYYTDYIFEF